MSIIKNSLISFLFLIIFLVLGLYRYHLYKYPSDTELSARIKYLRKYYSDELIMKIGNKLTRPESRINHFLRFPIKKEKDTIRIGTFGDSFTFGGECDKEASYPRQLQILLKRRFPLQRIEVLNFGMNAHSFQEQFFLWEEYAKPYKIDYILYGPQGLIHHRELTFGNRYLNFFPKDRFILSEKNKVAIVSLKGSSPEEKYKNYYSFLPSVRVFRYDKHPFQLWKSYLPFFKKLTNPFYYTNLKEHIESKMINQILLNKIRSVYDKKILLLMGSTKYYFNIYQHVKNLYNINFFNSFFKERLLYKRFGHLSSLGNEIVSHVYFNALIGKQKFNMNIFGCHYNRKTVPVNAKQITFNFKNVRKIFIGNETTQLNEVRLNISNHHHRKQGGSFFHNKSDNIKNFIGFSSFSANDFGLSPYFSIPFKLNKKNKIYVKFSKKKIVFLGETVALDTFERFFNFYTNYTRFAIDKGYRHVYVHFILKQLSQNLKEHLLQYKNGKIHLLIDNYVLGRLVPDTYKGEPSFVLKPRIKNSFLMMGPQHLVQEKELPSKFPLYIHYIMEDGRVLKSLISDWSCHKEKHTYQLELPNFDPLKKIYSSTSSHPL